MAKNYEVYKFGGSSVGSVEAIRQVIAILRDADKKKRQLIVVFSAFQGVTDELIAVAEAAAAGKTEYAVRCKELYRRHLDVAGELLKKSERKKTVYFIEDKFNRLSNVLQGIYLVREHSVRTLDFVMSFGERLSAFIISETLRAAGIANDYLDTRQVFVTDEQFGNARINYKTTNENIRLRLREHTKMQIATGFIAATPSGQTTTLGRGGSDLSASIFGAAVQADRIVIWTDVDGVLTADPGKVKRHISIERMSYEEAMEMSHFGARVIYPPTMQPALKKKIPLCIRNTFNTQFKGTVIGPRSGKSRYPISGISSIDDVALLRISGSGMVGVPGIARRIFAALAQNNISVILITQASSEHSICLAIMPQFCKRARAAIEAELKYEMRAGDVDPVLVETSLSVIAVVGENMRHTPRLAGRVFDALGRNGINIIAIAQGSSELNISAVIDRSDEVKALNALHDAFFLGGSKAINLFIVGTGLIGSTLLKQIRRQLKTLEQEKQLLIRVCGLANSRRMVFARYGLPITNWEKLLQKAEETMDGAGFVEQMRSFNLPNSIFVDCTASESIPSLYPKILKSSISIVAPNKKANAKNKKFYRKLREISRQSNALFMYETNVGASLPIINTIQDMVSTGDKILKIEGILSGTLSYIFNTFHGQKTFSEIVIKAQQMGYTEPDPREDLNGNDVARKLLILARESGYDLELKDIQVENLIPVKLRKSDGVETFLKKLPDFDEQFEKRKQAAQAENKVLRYIASLVNGKAVVSLQTVDKSHPFYDIKGSDNIIAIYSEHYKQNPLVIRGSGAGADNTAAGVFADILRAANYLS